MINLAKPLTLPSPPSSDVLVLHSEDPPGTPRPKEGSCWGTATHCPLSLIGPGSGLLGSKLHPSRLSQFTGLCWAPTYHIPREARAQDLYSIQAALLGSHSHRTEPSAGHRQVEWEHVALAMVWL